MSESESEKDIESEDERVRSGESITSE